tara:strand:- start:401 stop:850 length:450 start_codon:yes stop_codon:yes gene_type:complete
MPIKTITEMINEGILPDTLPKRTAIPNPINKDSWKSKTRIPLRKPQPSGPLAKDFSNKNMIKNRYGQWVEQKPLGSYYPNKKELESRGLEYSLMNPVVPTLTHADILQKWKNDTKQMEQLKAKLKRKEDDAKAKKESVVIDKRAIDGKA